MKNMSETISQFNKSVKAHAPKMVTLKIPNEFIGAVIGFVMINVISWESMDAQNAYQYTNPNVPCINRSVMIFGTLIA